ncbi:MAG: anaerobic sulfatase maturase [Erysipelotrichaceae bacterium]|nr:anaerobic sulfatase maturase [Erysipelotrichaceae bacterium]
MSDKLPFVLMAKPVGSACNMICDYCYYRDVNIKPQLMNDQTLETFIQKYIDENPSEVIKFFWHGGEPTLVGIDFYKKAIYFQKYHLPSNKKVFNNIQTNGFNLNDEWCEFLAKNKFDVGLSLDGSQMTHDHYRHDLKYANTYEKIVINLRRLQSYGIQPDLLCTINAYNINYPLDVYRTLKEFNTGWIQFIPIIETNTKNELTKESINAKDYGEFLCAIFDEWIVNDLLNVHVQMFADMELVAHNMSSTVCQTSKTCGNVLVIENNGNIYSCDHYVSDDYYLGNINTDSLQSILRSPSQTEFKTEKSNLPTSCRQCRWLRYCYGGCPKNRYLNDDNDKVYLLCDGLKTFFKHIDKPFKRFLTLKKHQYPTEQIMDMIKREYY